jgi:hypothetical protein
MILTAVTMSDGMGFNRASFLVDEERQSLASESGGRPEGMEGMGRSR